ncbi:MAG: M24 family metallopeptidase [Thermoanaerobaculia bacterium]
MSRFPAQICFFLLTGAAALAQETPLVRGRIGAPGAVLSQRGRVEPFNRILRDRLEHLLPRLMRETGIDLWVVINREVAEDPVFFTLVPQPEYAARRTTMLVFHDRGPEQGLDLLSVNRYPLSEPYQAAWVGGDLTEQWAALFRLLKERNPQRIALDVSRHWAVADGLTASLRDRLLEGLTPTLRERVVSAEELVVRWLETRTPLELEVWPSLVAQARGVVAEAFSERVVTPGVTTTDDVAWWIRQRYADLDLPVWFMPYVNAQRPGIECSADDPFCGVAGAIERGDVLHTDVGICVLGLCTDTQEMGYVLRPGETAPPAGLTAALAVGNRWQDLLTAEFRVGRTGNEVLSAARAAAEKEGIQATIYSHPLGVFGHGPGPTIGMWDQQGPTAVQGDWPIHASTGYAIEGNVKVPIPEWEGQLAQIKLEQSAVFDGARVVYLAGRQTSWHLVR